jgi:chorismate-pyruvate lyase
MTDSITATLDDPADGWAPPGARSLDADAFDRMVLTADGTVTTLLEACTGEPIVTATTRLAGPATLDQLLAGVGRWWHPDVRLVEPAQRERLIVRRVTLRGGRSGAAYVSAESLVAPDRLPDPVADRLQQPGASLGRVLAASQLETRRELLEVVAVRAGAVGDRLGLRPGAQLARRSYTIVVGRRTVAAVTEWLAPGRLATTTRATAHFWAPPRPAHLWAPPRPAAPLRRLERELEAVWILQRDAENPQRDADTEDVSAAGRIEVDAHDAVRRAVDQPYATPAVRSPSPHAVVVVADRLNRPAVDRRPEAPSHAGDDD